MRRRVRAAAGWILALALGAAGIAVAAPGGAEVDEEPTRPSAGAGPAFLEACDGYDDDLDGAVDEDCPCAPGDLQLCFPGAPGGDTGSCQPGVQRCTALEPGSEVGAWGRCEGAVLPTADRCGDGIDSDCDGFDLACFPGGGDVVKHFRGPDADA